MLSQLLQVDEKRATIIKMHLDDLFASLIQQQFQTQLRRAALFLLINHLLTWCKLGSSGPIWGQLLIVFRYI